jgi:hypothetical protein
MISQLTPGLARVLVQARANPSAGKRPPNRRHRASRRLPATRVVIARTLRRFQREVRQT